MPEPDQAPDVPPAAASERAAAGPIEGAPQTIEGYLRALLDNTQQPVMLAAPDYRLLLFNRAAQSAATRVFGRPMAVGQSLLDYVAPDQLDDFIAHARQALAGQQARLEWPSSGAGGTDWWELTFGPVQQPGSGVTGIVIIGQLVTDRRRTAAQLRRSEERAQALIANLPSGAAFVVDHDLRYLVADGEALNAARMRREDIIGRTVFEVLEPALAATYVPRFRQALAGVPFNYEHLSHGRWFVTRGVPLRDEQGAIEAVLVVSYDITDRKQAEESLRASEARLRLALDVAELGTWSWDLETGDGAIDERGGMIVGMTPGPFTDAAAAQRERVHPEDLAQLEADISAGVAGGHDFNLAYRVIHPDGSTRHIASRARLLNDEAGRPRRLVGTNRDVTAERAAEAALRASEARQRFLLQLHDRLRPLTDPEAIQYEAAVALGEHLGASRVGYAEDQGDGDTIVVTRNYTSGVPGIEGRYRYDDYGQELLRAFRVGRTVVRPDIAGDPALSENEKQAHAVLQLGATLNVPLLKGGRLVGVLFVHHRAAHPWTPEEVTLVEDVAARTWDSVERARAEARLERLFAQEQVARAQAEEASRLKDEFLATVSHELRTPLTAFLGYAQLLQARPRDPAYIAATVTKMVNSAKAQTSLIEDLLDISRIVSGKLRIEAAPLALADVVHAAVDTVRPAVEAKDLQLRLELDPALGLVLGDAGRLQQVVWNLLSNATKFTPPGGQVRVRLTSAGGDAELSVSDTGQGIPPEFLPFVFDRFRQADSSSKRVYAGLGLGLAIVRHLVELHGGSIRAESGGEGKGATFIMRLPLAGRRALGAEAAGPGPRAEGEPLHGLRVLVVDDQPAVLEVLAEMLALNGALVRTAESAGEALALVREWRPHALVSDIAMPGRDGYWLIRQVRELPGEAGATPALAVTAYLRMDDRLRVLAAGFQHYLTKPVDEAELRDALVSLIGQAPHPPIPDS